MALPWVCRRLALLFAAYQVRTASTVGSWAVVRLCATFCPARAMPPIFNV